jgi:hypothetical protein
VLPELDAVKTDIEAIEALLMEAENAYTAKLAAVAEAKVNPDRAHQLKRVRSAERARKGTRACRKLSQTGFGKIT